MAKIELGKAPKSFKRTVAIPLHDGSSSDVEFTFKYRTRSEYAAFVDAIIAKTDDKPVKGAKAKNSDETHRQTISQLYAQGAAADVDFILSVAEGWDLSDEFNKESVARLVDEFPGAPAAIGDTYRLAVSEGRVKN